MEIRLKMKKLISHFNNRKIDLCQKKITGMATNSLFHDGSSFVSDINYIGLCCPFYTINKDGDIEYGVGKW